MPASDPPATAPDAAPVVIRLDDVGKRFGDVVAVEHARLEVRRGEFFSLLGPSGCGKTTLLRLIAGFEAATSGRILLEGVDVARVPPHRRNVNTVFQQYALFPHLTVADNVAFGPRMRGLGRAETRARVAALLAVVRLGELGARYPAELSGGQKQRVALARALVNEPSALLLDEPLAALDLKLRQAMQLELKRIQREVGITFVFVTHDQEEALTMSDRIAVMRAGRIEQVGSPQEIYDAPATSFVAGFFGSANLLPATVEHVRGGRATALLAGRHPTAALCVDEPERAPGDAATLMIRPERIRLSPEPPDGGTETAFPVTVVEASFRGPVVRHVVRDAHGLELVVHVAADGSVARPAAGETAWVSWPAEAARLLPPEGA